MAGEATEENEVVSSTAISVKINPIRRLCRVERRNGGSEYEGEGDGEGNSVAACPQVLRHLCPQLKPSYRSGRACLWSDGSLAKLRAQLVSLPYWRRCLCSREEVPVITELELLPLLNFTPAHRFIIIIVTSSSESLGSVVVGGESLVKAVYAAQNLPGLRPCLQSPSEPSLAFIRYDSARNRTRRRERRGVATTLLNGGRVKIGMVLIYQKTHMLYSGFPLSSYGCMRQDFLSFISKYTRYSFQSRPFNIEPNPDSKNESSPDSCHVPDPDSSHDSDPDSNQDFKPNTDQDLNPDSNQDLKLDSNQDLKPGSEHASDQTQPEPSDDQVPQLPGKLVS